MLTTTFPYGTGEQFIESEIACWDEELALVPGSVTDGRCRDRGRCSLVLEVAQEMGKLRAFDFHALVKTAFSGVLVREVFSRGGFLFAKPRRLGILIRNLYLATRYAKALENYLGSSSLNEGVSFYCYWSSWQALAVCLLKKNYPQTRFITRAHRGDLYEFAASGGYLPFMKYICSSASRVFTVSDDGRAYLLTRFDLGSQKVVVSKLGTRPINPTQIGGGVSEPGGRRIRVISISYCKPVKRVGLIGKMLRSLSREERNTCVEWLHVGGGEQLEAVKASMSSSGVQCSFPGQVSNSEVRHIFQTRRFDMLVNLSSSEGIPVSMMEAISCGVPIVATDVGGVRELVVKPVGVLINEKVDFSEFYEAVRAVSMLKSDDIREFWNKNHNAEICYPSFRDAVVGALASPTA